MKRPHVKNQDPSKATSSYRSRLRVAAGLGIAGAVASLAGGTAPKPAAAPNAPAAIEAEAAAQGGEAQNSRVGEILDAAINRLAGSVLTAAEGNPHATREAHADGTSDVTLANAKGPRACVVTLAVGADGKPQVISYSSVEQKGGRTTTLQGMLMGSSTSSGGGGYASGSSTDVRNGEGYGGAVNTWDNSDGGSPDDKAQSVAMTTEQNLPEVLGCAAGQ